MYLIYTYVCTDVRMYVHTHMSIETPHTQSVDTDTLHPCITRRLTLRTVHGEHHHLRQRGGLVMFIHNQQHNTQHNTQQHIHLHIHKQHMHMAPTHHPYTNVYTHTYEMLCIHIRTHTYKVIQTQTYTYVLCVHMYAQPTHNRTTIT